MSTGVSFFCARNADDQRKAVHLRQHSIDDRNFIAALVRQVVAAHPVGGVIDEMAGFAERLDEIGGGVAIVFDDENPHGSPIHDRLLGQSTGGRPQN